MTVKGFLCSPRIYEYAGWTFEFPAYGPPWPLRKDGEPRARAGRKFYRDIEPFLNSREQKKHRVGGGCQEL